MLLGEYSVVLTNSRKLVMKLGSQMCTCWKWQMTGLPCCYTLAVIAKANLWVYDFVHPMYKADTQRRIYNHVVHPIETHDIAIADDRTGRVVGGDELDDNYSHCILPPCNGRQSGRPPSKYRESQTQGITCCRCSKFGEVGHTRRTCHNPRSDFNSNYEGDVVAVEDLLDGSWVPSGGTS